MAKIFIIGDELTITGLNMVGFRDTSVATKENILEVFEKNKDKQIIVITHSLFNIIRERIKRMHTNSIILELPDMNGKGEDAAMEMLINALGEDRAKALTKKNKNF